MTDNEFTISDEIKPYLPIIGTVVRGIIYAGSMWGFTWAQTVTGNQTEMIISGLAFAGSFGWSVWQKFAAIRDKRRAEVAAAVASARKTMEEGKISPVTVVVTPEGKPNIAVPVPLVEVVEVSTTVDLNRAELARH